MDMSSQQFGRFARRGARSIARQGMRRTRRRGGGGTSRSGRTDGRREPIRAGRRGPRGANRAVLPWIALLIGIVLLIGLLIEVFGLSDDADGAEASVEGEHAVVERVVDGDTIVVTYDGDQERVRLLNIDTPETVHPERPTECLGPEASERMEELLAPGDEVRLAFDQERTDRYDRLLAGVYLEDTLINAQMARDGYGAPVHFPPNDRFLAEVEEAWEQAEADGVGMFAEDLHCTPAIP